VRDRTIQGTPRERAGQKRERDGAMAINLNVILLLTFALVLLLGCAERALRPRTAPQRRRSDRG
jgi:hypothetical protein